MITWQDWGTIPYREAWARQDEYRTARQQHTIPDHIICCDHPRVITTGRRDCEADWKIPASAVADYGIDLVSTNRGGKLTYHGPGQLVVYWIIDLAARGTGIRDFVHQVEEIVIRTLAAFDIASARDTEHPGVWVGANKIAAIGLHVQHGITQHGCAINYAVQLADYQYFVPCGIADRGITSMDQLGVAVTRTQLRDQLLQVAASVLGESPTP